MPTRKSSGWKVLNRHRSGREGMARMLSAMSPDRPCGTWELMSARAYPRILEKGNRWVRYMGHRTLFTAEKLGYVRRMPTRSPSKAPNPPHPRRVDKEILWMITPRGLLFMKEYGEFRKRLETDPRYGSRLEEMRRYTRKSRLRKAATQQEKEQANAHKEDNEVS